jgi:hypothetical protein
MPEKDGFCAGKTDWLFRCYEFQKAYLQPLTDVV